jgi:hypothetical protein
MFRRQSFNVAVREGFMFRPFMLVGALLALNFHPAAAQQPTQAQRDAIRASCRSDFMANCASVTPGGKEALECLLRNQAKLSSACNSAVSAIAAPESAPKPPAPAPAAAAPAPSAPPPAAAERAAPKPTAASPAEPAPKASAATQEAQLKTVRQSCTLNDFMAHCSWIKPSNPELLLCLQSNASDLSPACQTALQGLPAAQAPAASERRAPAPSKKSSAAREPATPPPASPTAAAAPARPSDDQKAAIRAACRSDFMANCSGVQPGGAAALQCLQGNSAKLSASCQSAVAAIGGGAPAASSSATPAASAPTPAVAPLGPIPLMRPREALGILAICRAEQQTICGGIPFGGGRVLSCLADHAPQLSLQCYEALARATR